MANVLNIENLTKSYGDRLLFGDLTFGVEQGDKIGIVARNGTGKTTLLRILAGVEDADSGNVVFRNDLRVGYLPQEPTFNGATVYEAALDNDCDPRAAAVLEYRHALATGDEELTHKAFSKMEKLGAWDYEDRLRQLLTRLEFTDLDAPVAKLSGGQRKRLAITRLVMAEPDFLILDEPTNHLDIVTLGILEEYLADFAGCVIVISHDRYFLDNIVDHLFVMEGNGVIRDFPGNYSDYRAYLDSQPAQQKPAAEEKKDTRVRAERPAKMSFKERKEFEALEAEIAALNKEKAELEELFASGADIAGDEFNRLSQRYSELGPLLDEKEMRWLELSEKL